jgi:hypothetical protein
MVTTLDRKQLENGNCYNLSDKDACGDFSTQRFVGLELLTAANMKMAVFWVVAPCSLVVYRRSGGSCCLRHQGDKRQLLPLKRR